MCLLKKKSESFCVVRNNVTLSCLSCLASYKLILSLVLKIHQLVLATVPLKEKEKLMEVYGKTDRYICYLGTTDNHRHYSTVSGAAERLAEQVETTKYCQC